MSMGGYPSQHFAALYPDMVKGFVALDTTPLGLKYYFFKHSMVCGYSMRKNNTVWYIVISGNPIMYSSALWQNCFMLHFVHTYVLVDERYWDDKESGYRIQNFGNRWLFWNAEKKPIIKVTLCRYAAYA